MVAGPLDGGFNLGNAHGAIILDSNVEEIVQRSIAAMDRGVGALGNSMQRFGDGVSRIGTNLTLLTAPLTAFGAAGIRSASSFEDALKSIEVRTGATIEQMEAIRQKALEIGRDTPFSAGQAAIAFEQLLTSGQSLAEAMETINSVMAGAAASGDSLGFVSDALTDIMAQFNLESSESEAILQALNDAAGSSSATFSDLVMGFQNVGPAAAAAGLSYRETAAALALMNENGVKGSEAGTALKSSLNALQRDTDDVVNTLRRLNVSLFNADGSARPLTDIMNDLRVAMADFTDEERTQALQDLSDTYGRMGIIAMTSGASLEDMLTLMDQGADVADIAAAKMETFSGAVKFVQGSIETLQINALTPFMEDSLTPMVRRIGDVVNRVNEWVVANPELTAQIVRIGAVIAALGPTLLIVGKAISAIGVLIATLATPVGLLIAGITALGIAYRENFLGIRDTLAPLIRTFGDFLSQIDLGAVFDIGTTLLSLTTPLGIIKTLFETIFDVSIFDLLIQGIESVTQIIANLSAGQGLIEALGLGGTEVEGFVTTMTDSFGNVVSFIQTTVIPGLQSLGAWFISDALPAVVQFVTGTVIPAIQNFVTFLGNVWTAVQPGLQALWSWFTETALPAVVGFVQGTVLPAIEGFVATLVDIWTRISPSLQALFDWFTTSALPMVVDFINNVTLPAIRFLIDTLVGFWESIRPGLETFLNWIIDTGLPLVVDFIEGPLTNAFGNIVSIITFLWSQVEPGLVTLRDGLFEIFNWINTNAIKPVLDLIGSIVGKVIEVSNEVQRILGEIGTTVGNTINNLNPFTGSGFLNQGIFHVPGRDGGGSGMAGSVYAITPRAQTELFVPSQNGNFIPNFEEFMSNKLMQRFGGGNGGNGLQIDQVTIHANSRLEGEMAGDGFSERMEEIQRSKG